MIDFLWRFGYRFGNDNNFRLAVLWGFALAHLIFNLVVFGFGLATDFFPIPEEVQRYNNLEFRGRFATDRELNPPSWFGETTGSLWGQLRWWSWTALAVMFVVNVVYIPIAFRDELSRAWRFAARAFRERRGSPATAGTPATAPAAPAGGATAGGGVARGIFSEFYVVAREIMGATLANLFTHRGR